MNRTCTFCVMDESNPAITFDAEGRCNCCRDALRRRPFEWWPGPEGQARMQALVATLKEQGRGKPYDAMIGLSGGVDSAYLAHVAVRELGLRVLAVHVDGGWNSEPAVRNIETLVRQLDLDLHTHVVEWQEMRDLQVAFLRASVLNQDIPQDHAFFSTLYRTAARFRIRNFLSGVNYASESVVPPGFGYPAMDGAHARAIHQRFGTIPLRQYQFMSLPHYLWLTRVRKVLTVHNPLNYLNYHKVRAQDELRRLYGWRDYGTKHSESRFTKFYQDIYLPRKFGFDKRRLHLSSLIVSGQLEREQAVAELAQPPISPRQEKWELKFIAKKLGMSVDELNAYTDAPPVDHLAYPNGMAVHAALSALKQWVRQLPQRSERAA